MTEAGTNQEIMTETEQKIMTETDKPRNHDRDTAKNHDRDRQTKKSWQRQCKKSWQRQTNQEIITETDKPRNHNREYDFRDRQTTKLHNDILRHDLGIFLSTKFAAVGLFHQKQIKLMIWSTRKQYYLGLWAFSQLKSFYIYNKKNMLK